MAEHFYGRTLPVADHLIDPSLPAGERIYSGPEFTFTQGLRRIPIRSRIECQDHLNLFADVHHGQHVRIKIGAHTAYRFDAVDIGQAKADDNEIRLCPLGQRNTPLPAGLLLYGKPDLPKQCCHLSTYGLVILNDDRLCYFPNHVFPQSPVKAIAAA